MSLDSAEVVMQKLINIATEKGDGLFTIRIIARRPGSVVPTSLAMFHQATIAQLGNIESWLPRIVGGGEYSISVNHSTNVGQRFTFTLTLPGAAFQAPILNAVAQPGWDGPVDLATSQVVDQGGQPAQQFVSTQFQPQFTQQPQQRPAFTTQPATAQAFQQMAATPAEQLLTVQREASMAREQLDKRQAEMDKRDIEDRMRREAHDRESKMKSEMNTQLDAIKQLLVAQKAPPEPKTDPMAAIAALGAVLAPIAAAFIKSSDDSKRLSMEMSQKQAELAATTAREIAAAQAKAAEANTTMMMKMLEKPSGPDPVMTMILEQQKSHAEGNANMMGQIVNAMGTTAKLSISMIETIAELTAPPEGSPVADAIKEGVKALGSLVGGASAGARQAIQSQQRAQQATVPTKPPLPQGPTPDQLTAARQRAATVNQQAQQQQQAHVQAQAQAAAQVQPANVVQFPPQPAVGTPAAQAVIDAVPNQPMPGAFDGVETRSTVDELEDLIRSHTEPVDAVAKYLLDNVNDPAMRGALAKVENDPSALVAEKFGMLWLSELKNQAYIERLGDSLEQQAEERGMAAPEDGDDPEPDAPDTSAAAVAEVAP